MRWNCSTATPSSLNDLEKAGILPGVIPPISAWWPLEARYILVPTTSVQEITVRSGKWDPPAAGWFDRITSPTFIPLFICYVTAVYIEPKWTGKWGALANSFPYQSKIPQEKSSLSLILVLIDIFWSIFPIYYAIDISLVEYNVSLIGSGVESAIRFLVFYLAPYDKVRWVILLVTWAFQSFLTRMDEVEDKSKAGP